MSPSFEEDILNHVKLPAMSFSIKSLSVFSGLEVVRNLATYLLRELCQKFIFPHLLNQSLNMPENLPPQKTQHPINVYVCAHTATVPQGQEDGLAGDHEEQVNMRSGGRRGKADGRVKSNQAKSLNPVEFLSSSAAPLGGVRSLWRERGKTGPVRNKAPNSHDMFC